VKVYCRPSLLAACFLTSEVAPKPGPPSGPHGKIEPPPDQPPDSTNGQICLAKVFCQSIVFFGVVCPGGLFCQSVWPSVPSVGAGGTDGQNRVTEQTARNNHTERQN
jgi:hypothetical protein